jgi:hypothetical protein
MFFIFFIFFGVFGYCFLSMVKFEWILARHANQSSSFLLTALLLTSSHKHACTNSRTNCDNGFFVSVLGSRGPHRILWPSLRKSCSTKLLCAKSNSEGGVSTSAPAMEEQSSPIISLRFIGVSETNLCTTLNSRKMFSQQKSLFAQCPPSDFFSNAL